MTVLGSDLEVKSDVSPGTWTLRALPVAKAASHGLTFCSADTLEDYMGHTGAVGKRQHTCTLVKHTWQLEAPFCSNQLNKKCPQDTFTHYRSQHCTVISALSKQYITLITIMNNAPGCIYVLIWTKEIVKVLFCYVSFCSVHFVLFVSSCSFRFVLFISFCLICSVHFILTILFFYTCIYYVICYVNQTVMFLFLISLHE